MHAERICGRERTSQRLSTPDWRVNASRYYYKSSAATNSLRRRGVAA